MRLVISSGHGKFIRGASGYIDEVDEARRVVNQVAEVFRSMNVEAITFHDDVSHTQSENLKRIVDFHNSKQRDIDVSVHFNSAGTTSQPLGCEVLYISSTGHEIASRVVSAICTASGLINRGAVYRPNLYFLKNTEEPAVLIEVCFVDSSADVAIYESKFNEICKAIAVSLVSGQVDPGPTPPPAGALFHTSGKCSMFGGPKDTGVSPSEGLAFISDVMQAPQLFLPYQPSGTSGLARRLNPYVFYVACRWDYDVTPKEMLRTSGDRARVRANGKEFLAFPADWGPHDDTGRVADLSPGLMEALGLSTDDSVEVVYPGED